MTLGSSLMSMPRAAISVATSTVTRPALKSPSARRRWPWLLLPWIAAVLMPDFSRNVASLSQPCLVRPNTRVCSRLSWASRCSSSSRLRAPSTGCTRWVMVSATVFFGVTWICAGSRMNSRASCLMLSSKVAENSRVWRFWRGSLARIFLIDGRKPMSSMRSASSSTRISMPDRSTLRRSRWSIRRPGQATSRSTPRRSTSNWLPMPTPP